MFRILYSVEYEQSVTEHHLSPGNPFFYSQKSTQQIYATIMKQLCLTYAAVYLFVPTGASWLLALTVWSGGSCEAFVGPPATTSNNPVVSPAKDVRHRNFSSFSLFDAPSSLLEGKVSVLQDVVKEMEARHQQLRDRSEAAEEDSRQKLKTLESDLEESKRAEGMHERVITSLKRDLEETQEKHARDLEQLEREKDMASEENQRKLSARNQHDLEELQKYYEDRVDRLKAELDDKKSQVKELSTGLTEATIESSTISKEKDIIIEELREQIAKQRKQIESFGRVQQQLQDDLARKEITESEERQAVNEERIRGLEAKHEQIMKENQTKLDALSCEKEKLSYDLKALSVKCDEQVEIATAAVKAGQTREENLRKESDRLSKELQRNWLVTRLLKLAMDGMAKENQILLDENHKLEQKFER